MPAYSKIVLRSANLLHTSIHTIIYSGITNITEIGPLGVSLEACAFIDIVSGRRGYG